jgi:hypothetical protein
VLAEALDAARDITDGWGRCKALIKLVPCLPEEERATVLAEALTSSRSWGIWDLFPALDALVPHLPADWLVEALPVSRSSSKEWDWPLVLVTLAPRLVGLSSLNFASLWATTPSGLAARTRPDLFADLRILAPVLVALAGPNASTEFREVARAISDVARWWP